MASCERKPVYSNRAKRLIQWRTHVHPRILLLRPLQKQSRRKSYVGQPWQTQFQPAQLSGLMPALSSATAARLILVTAWLI